MYLAGYGIKSPCWFVDNPLAKTISGAHPLRRWSWDVGRTVRLEEHPGTIPVFCADLLAEDLISEGMKIRCILGGRASQGFDLFFLLLEEGCLWGAMRLDTWLPLVRVNPHLAQMSLVATGAASRSSAFATRTSLGRFAG